jgi:hypothetical protein
MAIVRITYKDLENLYYASIRLQEANMELSKFIKQTQMDIINDRFTKWSYLDNIYFFKTGFAHIERSLEILREGLNNEKS